MRLILETWRYNKRGPWLIPYCLFSTEPVLGVGGAPIQACSCGGGLLRDHLWRPRGDGREGRETRRTETHLPRREYTILKKKTSPPLTLWIRRPWVDSIHKGSIMWTFAVFVVSLAKLLDKQLRCQWFVVISIKQINVGVGNDMGTGAIFCMDMINNSALYTVCVSSCRCQIATAKNYGSVLVSHGRGGGGGGALNT